MITLSDNDPVSIIINVYNEVGTIENEILNIHSKILSKLPGSELIIAEDGSADGAPPLPRRSMYLAWARILGREYAELVSDAEQGRSSLLDVYGATNPAEFFAVATEFFFEAPVQLRAKHPELYEELKLYYQQDPAAANDHSANA